MSWFWLIGNSISCRPFLRSSVLRSIISAFNNSRVYLLRKFSGRLWHKSLIQTMKSSLVKQKHSLQVSRRADHTYNDIFGRKCFVFNRAQSWIDCEMFIVFSCLLWCHGKSWKHNVPVAISLRSLNERIQMCIECKCWTNKILLEKKKQ